MERYIHNYMSSNYYIATSEVGNDGIYGLNNEQRYKTPEYGSVIIKELDLIFSLDEETLKVHIECWAVSVKVDVDLKFYWSIVQSLFPQAARVFANTVALDIIPVQPMSAPSSNLFYMDYVYSGATTFEEILPKKVQKLLPPSPEEKFRQSWFNRLLE